MPSTRPEIEQMLREARHDHRRSVWVLGLGWLWCYRCGAIRPNTPGRHRWTKPTGPDGPNPAMRNRDPFSV